MNRRRSDRVWLAVSLLAVALLIACIVVTILVEGLDWRCALWVSGAACWGYSARRRP